MPLTRNAKRRTRQEHKNMLKNFQGTLAEAITLKKGTDVETEANDLCCVEQQRCQARNVKRMRRKMSNSQVTKLWHTEDNGSRCQCNAQALMESACFAENKVALQPN
jgi:hypothetical protein